MDIENILGPGGLVAEHMEGYEYRREQVEAALAVQEALQYSSHCLVEAGTGVGKSMAYLIPAINHALQGRRVVVSTFTLYLQSQLINKDIPFLQSILPGRKLKVALVKGRGNYLCLSNFDAELGQLLLLQDPNTVRLQQWALKTETGDVAEIDFSPTGWGDICSDLDTCHRNGCAWYNKCFYYKMRKSAAEADIIITNHSLFLSDLAIRTTDPNAGILPDYDAVIFDEAHHLEDVATKAFGVECGKWRVPSLVNKLRRLKGAGINPERLAALEDLNSELFLAFEGARKPEFFFRDIYSMEGQERVEGTATMLSSTLAGVYRELGELETDGQPELKERIDGLKRISGRINEDLSLLFFGPTEGYFKWGERSASAKYTNCTLRYSPLSVADILGDVLWSGVNAAVLTSATLSNSGTFNYIKSRLGMPESVESIQDSPFDFKKQCLLYIPRHLPLPSEQAVYADMVAKEIEGIVRASGGRAFLLFTSYRMMNAVYERLSLRLPYVMMKQGDMPNETLVAEFLRQGNACLFGVHSFWEGVDIRGEALSCVVIDKLPFASPDNPVTKARTDAIIAADGDWFNGYSIPQAQMKLKQGFGRLIRTKSDRGVVAVLDSRLVKKSYGREFLRFLPQCPVTFKLEDVKAFFA